MTPGQLAIIVGLTLGFALSAIWGTAYFRWRHRYDEWYEHRAHRRAQREAMEQINRDLYLHRLTYEGWAGAMRILQDLGKQMTGLPDDVADELRTRRPGPFRHGL